MRIQDRLRIDFTLEVGGASEAVVVTTEAPILQTQEGSLGQVIESKQIEALPVNGRSFLPAGRPDARSLAGRRLDERQRGRGRHRHHQRHAGRRHELHARRRRQQQQRQSRPSDRAAQSRRHRGVQGADLELLGGVRPQRRRGHQHDDQGGGQRHEGHRVPVRAQPGPRCPRLLRRPERAEGAVLLLPVRRNRRRADQPREDLLLRRLPGHEVEALGHPHSLGPHRPDAGWRFLGGRQSDHHRSADRPALPGQRDPAGSHVSAGAQAFIRPLSEPQPGGPAQQLRGRPDGDPGHLPGRSAPRRELHGQRRRLPARLLHRPVAVHSRAAAGDRGRRRLRHRGHEPPDLGRRRRLLEDPDRATPSTSSAPGSTGCRRTSAFRSEAPSCRRRTCGSPACRWTPASTA